MTYLDYSGSKSQTTLVRRQRTLPKAGSRTLHFHAPGFGKSGLFLRPEEVPEFDGEEATGPAPAASDCSGWLR